MMVTVEIVARGSLEVEVDEDTFDEVREELANGPMNADNFPGEIVEQDLLDCLLCEITTIEPAEAKGDDDGEDE